MPQQHQHHHQPPKPHQQEEIVKAMEDLQEDLQEVEISKEVDYTSVEGQ